MEGVRLGYEPRKKRALLRWVPPVSEKRRGPGCRPKKEGGGGARLLGRARPLDRPSARGRGVLGRGGGKQARGAGWADCSGSAGFPLFSFLFQILFPIELLSINK